MNPRSIRMLRRSLIGLVIVVLLAVLFNYLHTWRLRTRAVKKAVQILGTELLRSVESIEYSDNRDGVPRFKIRAKRLLETREGKSYLQGIEAYDFNPDGSARNEIHSQSADYDREHNVANFTGDVRLFLSDGIELRTSALHYDFNAKVGHTPEKLQFVSSRMTGSATGVRFDQKENLLELQRDVDLVLKSGGTGPGGAAVPRQFHAVATRAFTSDSMQRIVFQGGAHVESNTESLSAGSIEAALSQDRKRVTSLSASGNAIFKSSIQDKAQTLSGDRMAFVLNRAQVLEKISVTGQAAYSSLSSSEEESLRGNQIDLMLDPITAMPVEVQGRNQVLFHSKRKNQQIEVSGEQLIAKFRPGGKVLDGVTVQRRAILTVDAGGDSVLNEIQSEDIRVKFQKLDGRATIDSLRAEGSTRWVSRPKPAGNNLRQEPARSMDAALVEMVFARNGDFLDRGSASGNVVVTESIAPIRGRSQLRRLLSDRMQFQFFPGNNRIRNMKADGNVQALYEKREGSGENQKTDRFRTVSEKMEAIFGLRGDVSVVDSAAQWGRFRFEGESMSATAGRCDYDARSGILALTEDPRIVDAMSATTGDRMEFEQQQGTLSVYGRVRSLLKSKGNTGSFLKSSSSSASIITADTMKYWMKERRANYSGKVLVLDEGTQLQAGKLEILEGGDRVEAQESVRHLIPDRSGPQPVPKADKAKEKGDLSGGSLTIRSASLSYLKRENRVTYAGGVHVASRDFDLSSERLDATIAENGGGIEHATARGKVIIRQRERECKGDAAEYSLNPGRFVLTGNPAEVYDPEKGHSKAGRLTSFIADDRILLEGR